MSTPGSATPARRGLYGLLAANVVSLTGTRLSMIALPWYVITTTGDAVSTGAAAFAQMTPYVIAKALAGPLVDRHGARRVTVTAELIAAVAVGTIPVLHATLGLPFAAFLAAVAVVGAASGPADGAKYAMTPAVADQAAVPLERVTGLTGMIDRLASTVGAAAAGGTVALLGALPALSLNAATFAVAALIIAATAPRTVHQTDGRYLHQLRDGAAFLRRDQLLRNIYGMVAMTNLLDAAAFSVLLPVWAHSTGRGPADIGLLAATFGAAAVAASGLSAAIGHRLPRRATYLVSFLIAGAPRFLVLAVDVPLPAIVVVFAASGFGAGFINPILGAVIFGRIPADLVGRVSALGTSLAWAGVPLGGPLAGGLVAVAGMAPALVLTGLAYLVTTTLPALQRSWHSLDQAPGTRP